MEPVTEALRLLQRKTELEAAMREPGGIRITEERELYRIRDQLGRYPHAVRAILTAASSLRRNLADLTVPDIEHWTGTDRH